MRGADVAHARTAVGRRYIFGVETIARHADAGDHQYVAGLIEFGVGRAFDEARIADHADDLGIVDKFRGHLSCGFRIPLIVFNAVMDWTAVDAAVGVDAIEISRGRLRRAAEVGGTGLADDRPDLDWLTRCCFAVAQSAFRRVGRRSRRCRQRRCQPGTCQGQHREVTRTHVDPPLFTQHFCRVPKSYGRNLSSALAHAKHRLQFDIVRLANAGKPSQTAQ